MRDHPAFWQFCQFDYDDVSSNHSSPGFGAGAMPMSLPMPLVQDFGLYVNSADSVWGAGPDSESMSMLSGGSEPTLADSQITSPPQLSVCSEEDSANSMPLDLTMTPEKKRKRVRKPLSPSVAIRRREQNRDAQRAYRERKEQRIKELEAKCAAAEQKNEVLRQAFALLSDQCMCMGSHGREPSRAVPQRLEAQSQDASLFAAE